ncbi:tRNA pseudouridine(55) synthase TruB [Candidatus Omnitrophota bacterium]
MDGVLLVDKPQTWTSNDVCQFVKKKFRFKKVGHAGTLDPNATGLMVLLINKATKLADSFLVDDKDYEGELKLGLKTSTGDSEGDIVETKNIEAITQSLIFGLTNVFKGDMKQVPPMTSALKKNGVRLYKLARKGKVVPREPRSVTIHGFKINKIMIPLVQFFVSVSKGFYVRTLAEDIGEHLGCGAMLTSLRRVRSGKFLLEEAVTIDTLRLLETVDELVPYINGYELNNASR